jgi:biopolymer transport protein ExbB
MGWLGPRDLDRACRLAWPRIPLVVKLLRIPVVLQLVLAGAIGLSGIGAMGGSGLGVAWGQEGQGRSDQGQEGGALDEAGRGRPTESASGSPAPGGSGVAVSPSPRAGVDRQTLLRLLFDAHVMLWPLALCSVLTLGFALERFLALRRRRVVPAEFVDRFLERLASGKLDQERALELCRAHDSPAARIFGQVVKSWGQPGALIRQNLSFDAAGEILEMKRNLRVLSAMATIGPLLGLLGTVVGIIQSFDALGGKVGPSRGEALAQGISLALVATAFGLAIAIVAVAVYAFLMSRIDLLVRELDEKTRQVIELVSAEAARAGSVDRRLVGRPLSDPARTDPRFS